MNRKMGGVKISAFKWKKVPLDKIQTNYATKKNVQKHKENDQMNEINCLTIIGGKSLNVQSSLALYACLNIEGDVAQYNHLLSKARQHKNVWKGERQVTSSSSFSSHTNYHKRYCKFSTKHKYSHRLAMVFFCLVLSKNMIATQNWSRYVKLIVKLSMPL